MRAPDQHDEPPETPAGANQSPNWDRFKDVSGFVQEGFPFDEGFPPYDLYGTYEIITRDGQRHEARIDYSTQYRSEGKQWRTVGGETIGKQVVIAWRKKST